MAALLEETLKGLNWKMIPGYEGKYGISDQGDIIIFDTGKLRKRNLSNKGYPIAMLWLDGIPKGIIVHRLVAQAFVPNPENKKEVNHINGVKTDARAVNLEWCTRSENMIHCHRTGMHPCGEGHWKAKLTYDQVDEIRSLKGVMPTVDIAERFGVYKSTIQKIQARRIWAGINPRHSKLSATNTKRTKQ